jgi:hypothetical protein
MFRLPAPALALLAAALSATPANAQLLTIRVCVIESTELREIEAQYNTMTGDTTVAGRPFGEVHPVGSSYAAATSWFVNNEPIEIDGFRFVKYGLPRILGMLEVTRFTEYQGVGIYAEAGARGTPEVVYVPVRTGCEFQPYQRDTGDSEPEAGGPSGPRSIEIPRALGEALDFDDDEWEERLYDDYAFTGTRGQSVVAEMRSDEFDTVLHLGRLVAGELEILASSDDGFGSGTDSRFVAELPADGEYVLRATSFDREFGGYVILVANEGSEPDWSPVEVRAGDRIDAHLTLADAVFAEDTHFDEYEIDVTAGQRLLITLSSAEFDTYLSVERRIGDAVEEVESNDDAPGLGTNSQIDLTFAESGTYTIVASSYAPDTAGAYELRVEGR